MSKYTLGPWEWDDEVPTCYSETDWSEVAPWLVDSNGNDVLSGQIVCKNKADLALIAAAPELLEALQYMLAVCPAIDGIGEEARSEAREAIARATAYHEPKN